MKSSSLAFLGVRGKSISRAFRTRGERGEGEGGLPYIAYTVMCRWTGYGF